MLLPKQVQRSLIWGDGGAFWQVLSTGEAARTIGNGLQSWRARTPGESNEPQSQMLLTWPDKRSSLVHDVGDNRRKTHQNDMN